MDIQPMTPRKRNGSDSDMEHEEYLASYTEHGKHKHSSKSKDARKQRKVMRAVDDSGDESDDDDDEDDDDDDDDDDDVDGNHAHGSLKALKSEAYKKKSMHEKQGGADGPKHKSDGVKKDRRGDVFGRRKKKNHIKKLEKRRNKGVEEGGREGGKIVAGKLPSSSGKRKDGGAKSGDKRGKKGAKDGTSKVKESGSFFGGKGRRLGAFLGRDRGKMKDSVERKGTLMEEGDNDVGAKKNAFGKWWNRISKGKKGKRSEEKESKLALKDKIRKGKDGAWGGMDSDKKHGGERELGGKGDASRDLGSLKQKSKKEAKRTDDVRDDASKKHKKETKKKEGSVPRDRAGYRDLGQPYAGGSDDQDDETMAAKTASMSSLKNESRKVGYKSGGKQKVKLAREGEKEEESDVIKAKGRTDKKIRYKKFDMRR